MWVWRSFWSLTNDRQIGFGGIGGIAFTAIDGYARRYKIVDLDEFETLLELIQRLDAEYLAIVNKPRSRR